MQFKKFSFDEEDKWNRFCMENDLAWFWHTSFRLRHALNGSTSGKSENHSFYLEQSKEIIAIIPLTINICNPKGANKTKQIIEMNYGGMAVPCPVVKQSLSQVRKEKILNFIFKEIDKIASANGVQRLIMRIPLTLSYCKKYPYHNFLIQYGFQDISLNTSVVDLEQSEKDIRNNMSENHRRSILKGEEALKFELFDQKNIAEDVLKLFKKFYIKVSQKQDYPEERFRLLFFYLKQGMAVIGQALYQGKVVGYVVTVFYKNDAYYLMGANENNFAHCPIAHAIHWEVIKYLKQRGISHYELGIQQFGPLLYNLPSAKEVSISLFKRKFGGVILPYFIGEKFYSKKYFKDIWNERLEKYFNFVK